MTEETITFDVTEADNGERVDRIITQLSDDLTRSAVQKLIENGNVTVNSKICGKNMRLKTGDRIEVALPEPTPLEVVPENIPLDIKYEDDDLLVVNKKKGMVVHPAAGNFSGTLVNALLAHCGDSLSGINGVIRPGIVHRIDKDTSGLLIVAKNDLSHRHLAEQIKAHSFTREYQSIVYGHFQTESGTVDKPIGRSTIDRKKMAVTEHNSKNAVTHYEVLREYNGFTHLKLRLETGRTHQIRVHMSHIGHPVAGDAVYGPKKVIAELNGQCLHAEKIGFIHPRDGRYIEIESGLPPYFTDFIKKLEHKL